MILRLVLGLSDACAEFVTTGVITATRMSFISELGDLFCKGVAGMGVEFDPSALVFIVSVADVAGDACATLTSEEGLGDSGFDGCASIMKKIGTIFHQDDVNKMTERRNLMIKKSQIFKGGLI